MIDLYEYSERSFELDRKLKEICKYIIDYKYSIRQTAEESCIPRSTVHYYIHNYISYYYDEEYQQIKTILRYNKQHRSMPRKYWKRYGL